MKFSLAFVSVLFLVFQVTDLRHASSAAVADGAAGDEDNFVIEINLLNDPSMQNTSAGTVEETGGRNTSTNDTYDDWDYAEEDVSSNESTKEDDDEKKSQKFFHDDTEGIVVIFVIAIIIAGIFLFPVFNHCRKSYTYNKPVAQQEESLYPPTYQELMQREELMQRDEL